MKKTTQIFKTIIAIAVVTFFISCKKEIDRPQKDLNTRYNVLPGVQVVNPSAISKNPKTSPGYVGTSTLGDTAAAHN